MDRSIQCDFHVSSLKENKRGKTVGIQTDDLAALQKPVQYTFPLRCHPSDTDDTEEFYGCPKHENSIKLQKKLKSEHCLHTPQKGGLFSQSHLICTCDKTYRRRKASRPKRNSKEKGKSKSTLSERDPFHFEHGSSSPESTSVTSETTQFDTDYCDNFVDDTIYSCQYNRIGDKLYSADTVKNFPDSLEPGSEQSPYTTKARNTYVNCRNTDSGLVTDSSGNDMRANPLSRIPDESSSCYANHRPQTRSDNCRHTACKVYATGMHRDPSETELLKLDTGRDTKLTEIVPPTYRECVSCSNCATNFSRYSNRVPIEADCIIDQIPMDTSEITMHSFAQRKESQPSAGDIPSKGKSAYRTDDQSTTPKHADPISYPPHRPKLDRLSSVFSFRSHRSYSINPDDGLTALTCLDCALQILNIFIFLVSAGAVAAGIWSLTIGVNVTRIAILFGNELPKIIAYGLIGGGGLTLLLSFCMCCGIRRDRSGLGCYLFSIFVVTIIIATACVMSIVFRDKLSTNTAKEQFHYSIAQTYGFMTNTSEVNQYFTESVDILQQAYQCCGAYGSLNDNTSWALYRKQSLWHRLMPPEQKRHNYVPKSCCDNHMDIAICQGGDPDLLGPPLYGPPLHPPYNAKNVNLYVEGCFEPITNQLFQIISIGIIVLGTVCGVLFLGMILTIVLCVKVGPSEDDDMLDEEEEMRPMNTNDEHSPHSEHATPI
ncbi:hypothetical protein ACJMK2_002176 [Sinanodonta woodiana]|uniref:Tetraspanin n=1 Tax=Sinanodonta woodiana TaxID=1069815 RepID=A0ABD3XUE8_SINWO